MPWKEHGVMEERFGFVADWESGDWSMAELSRYYGVTRATGYKWVERYEMGGVKALEDRSRAAHRHANAVSWEMEDLVLGMRAKHPSWGAPKIHAKLESEQGGKKIPVESTIGEILNATG